MPVARCQKKCQVGYSVPVSNINRQSTQNIFIGKILNTTNFPFVSHKTLTFKSISTLTIKVERVTVIIGCNGDVSDKFPLLFLCKRLKPCCFENVKKLAVEFEAN